ncbi:MAG: acyl--CoA ligase [SAR324 cluster bacterium]|nr:acyl--CoA ligase [SAR324 cluster bacterium]
MLIGDLIQRRAHLSPDRVYWQECGQRWRYAELNAAANQVARAFLAEGLGAGDHAAICAPNCFAYACAHFGAAKAGVVLAHLNAGCTASELAALAAHCDARVLLFGSALTGEVGEARARLPLLRRLVRLPDGESQQQAPQTALQKPAPEAPRWAIPWTRWIAGHDSADAGHEAPALEADAPFQLLYTSGTTGFPKGALISHRAKIRQGTTHALNLGLAEGHRVLSALPLYHQFAQWLLFASVPIAGATVVAEPRFSASRYWQRLGDAGITHLPAVPTLLYRLLDAPEAAQGRAAALRCIVYGGAPIDPRRIPALRARFPGVRLFQGFGQTETGYCLGLADEDHDGRPESIGRPDLFSEVRLLGEDGREVAPGEVGEIVARTPYLMNGYHKDPAATAGYFAYGARWGRTGDLAVRDEAGFFTLAGRKSDLVISGGVNLYPAEVERVLLSHPAVADAAVFGVPDADRGEVLVAAVIPHAGQAVEDAQLDAHCRAALAAFKCPRRYFVADAFPRTHSGKVQKFALREQWLANAARPPP